MADPSPFPSLRKVLSDLADAATRGATRPGLAFSEFESEMRTINASYAEGLKIVSALEGNDA